VRLHPGWRSGESSAMSSHWKSGLLLAVLALGSLGRAQTTAWSISGDFSATANPNGPWNFGWSGTPAGALTPFTLLPTGNALTQWSAQFDRFNTPTLVHNATSATVSPGGTALPYAAGASVLHPGPNGEFAIAQWTAPIAGTFALATAFSNGDTVGATTDISVLRNSTVLGTGSVTFGTSYLFSANPVTLAPGDTLRFVVGNGGNGHNFDSTFVSAQITALAVPEPSTWMLVVAVGQLRRRRR